MKFSYLEMRFKITFVLSFFFCSISLFGLNQNSFLTKENKSYNTYIREDETVALDSLRNVTHFLTNRNIVEYNNWIVPKRKKAFLRHVKQVSESIEEFIYAEKKVNDSIHDALLKLEYLKASLLKKAAFNSSPFPSLKDQIEMGRNTRKSHKFFQYQTSSERITERIESIYWKEVHGKQHKQFKKLAKSKKIKPKDDMVVLFEELSHSGSAPKVRTLDLDFDNEWSLKWGDEVHTDVVCSRIFAALGYDVDHPYFYAKNNLTLVFDETKTICSWEQLSDSLFSIYSIHVDPFVSKKGKVTPQMAASNLQLQNYIGYNFVQFVKCALEARPDRVKRLGSFLPDTLGNRKRAELRSSILAHAFIGNWDTREQNTLLTNVHEGKYIYHISGVFSDLGSSMGVKLNFYPIDFKVGLVNHFGWNAVVRKRNKIYIKNKVNAILPIYENISYADLEWMARKISLIDSTSLRKCINKAGWPKSIGELYFHKLASRRASIIASFELTDPYPIDFDRKLNIRENHKWIVKNGRLRKDFNRNDHPESFTSTKGRKRNYGN